MSTEYRNFLALSYDELEDMNLAAKADRLNRVPIDKIREKRLKYLTDEKRIKAVTVLFTDLEGRLHLLDYDKKFLLGAYENLTFDGSSIRGFTAQKESDLRLGIDWSAFYWVPADVFGNGKVLVFGNVIDKDGTPYSGDLRGVLKSYSEKLFKEKNYTLNAATEIEGFLFAGKDAERKLPRDRQIRVHQHRRLLSRAAARSAAPVHRHCGRSAARHGLPEREGPSRGGAQPVRDQLWLCRSCGRGRPDPALQAALPPDCQQHGLHGMLPAQAGRRRERQRHAHQRLGLKGKTNLFWDEKGEEKLSKFGWDFLDRILSHALDLCLIFNSSVNAYRRLDPHFEAPNQIRASAVDRGAMIRVPIGNSPLHAHRGSRRGPGRQPLPVAL